MEAWHGRKADYDDVINYLVAAGVSSEISRTLDTAQNIAVSWLALDDEAIMLSQTSPLVAEGYRYMTRYVLLLSTSPQRAAQLNFQAGFGTIRCLLMESD
jgi:hypothetical protein